MTYESEILHDWYILFHYGTPEEILSGSAFSEEQLPAGALDFPSASVEAFRQSERVDRALDVGCAVGRSSYELSRIADEVIGIDFSQKFVNAAAAMKSREAYSYHIYGEAHLREAARAHLPPGCRPERVTFEQGDAMELRWDLGIFDLVHAANLLCRLSEPLRFLARLPGLVKPGGRLVLATPATWMSEYTPPGNIPSGETLDFLKTHLCDAFDFREAQEIPFFIREHKRKFQLSTSQTSLWVRKE